MKRRYHHRYLRYIIIVPAFLFLVSIPVATQYFPLIYPGIFANLCLSILVVYLVMVYLLSQRDYAVKNLLLLRQSVQLSRSETQLNIIFNSVPLMIWYKDRNNVILRANQRAAASMGMTVDELQGKSTYDLYPEHAKRYHDDDLEVIRSGAPKYGIIEPYAAASGETLWVCTDKIPYRNELGKIIGVIVIAKDITQLKKLEERQKFQQLEVERTNEMLQALVATDSLTGLLNRRGLEHAIQSIAEDIKLNKTTGYALLLDLDNFKEVNHTFGFVVGDMEIKNVGVKLQSVIEDRGYVGRIGGDEYMILIPHTDRDEIVSIAENLRLAVSDMTVGMSSGNAIRLTVSIGVVPMTAHSTSLEELIERTYYALSQCKDWGKNTVSVNGKMGYTQNESGKRLSGMLRDDADPNAFYAMYQSIVDLNTSAVYGHELLIRLEDPHYRMPNDFFRLAIESKMLTHIDRLCLRTCLAGASKLHPDSRIHVNLFPSTLIQIPTTQLIEEFDRTFGLSRFCIEISEQQIVGDSSNLIEQIETLKRAGILIALDDVGFGSSCLESLIMLQPNIVKIDMSIVQGATKNNRKLRDLQRLVKVVRSCDAIAIAEGIETKEELEIVKKEGIELGQGYLFSKPTNVVSRDALNQELPRIL